MKFDGMQLKEAVSFHWAFSLLYPKHMVHLLRYGFSGFTRMEHLNFNSSVEISFSNCVCLASG